MEHEETIADTAAEPGAGTPQKDEEPDEKATDRSAYVRFRNQWGQALASATIRHRYANDPGRTEERTWKNVPANGESPSDERLEVTYRTGFGTDYDYWWASIELNNGDVYSSKESFYCYLTSSDEGGEVWAVVDGQTKSLRINPPSSSSCVSDSMRKQ